MVQAWSREEEIEGRLDTVFDGNSDAKNEWLDSIHEGLWDTPRRLISNGAASDLNELIGLLSQLSKK